MELREARQEQGAGGNAEGVVFVEIVAELFVIADAGQILDRALDGHDAHQAVAVGDQRGHGLHADAGVLLEGAADLGVCIEQLLVVNQHLHDAGGKDLHEVFVHAELLVVGAAEDADPREVLGELLHLLHGLADLFGQPRGGADLAQARGDGDVGLIVGDDAGQTVILGSVLVDLVHNAGQTADDLTQLDDFGSEFCHSFSLLQRYFCGDTLLFDRISCYFSV